MVGAKSTNVRCVQIISNIPNQWDKIINFAKEFDEYYYIFHDKDTDEDGNLKKKHIHCVVYDKNGTSLLAWINRWSGIVPPQFVERVLFKQPTLRYLTHETAQAISDGKYKYPRSAVVTNKIEKYLSLFNNTSSTVPERLQDFTLVKTKKMSVEKYVEKYRTEIDNLNFYQQNKLFAELFKYGL